MPRVNRAVAVLSRRLPGGKPPGPPPTYPVRFAHGDMSAKEKDR